MAVLYKAGEAEKLQAYIGEDIYKRQLSGRHVCIPIESDAVFLAFWWCDVRSPHKKDERIAVYCGKKGLVYAGDSERCAKIMAEQDKNEEPFHALADFFSELTAGDVDTLEHYEDTINELEQKIITAGKPLKGISARIIELRRSFLKMKRYYEQLAIVLEQLSEDGNKALPDGLEGRFEALSRRVRYLTQSVVDLREYVTQVREAYQAEIDIEQNQIMKIFTVITSIFLPLTLIVGWYGMNLQMPEFSWRFGYPFVIVLSICVCVFCMALFKRKKWF